MLASPGEPRSSLGLRDQLVEQCSKLPCRAPAWLEGESKNPRSGIKGTIPEESPSPHLSRCRERKRAQRGHGDPQTAWTGRKHA